MGLWRTEGLFEKSFKFFLLGYQWFALVLTIFSKNFLVVKEIVRHLHSHSGRRRLSGVEKGWKK
jgi:hypothetical protein